MEPVTTHTGRAVALRRSNVDTDQIIPAVYLKRVTRSGFEDGLFAAWRSDPDFVLNRPESAGASVLSVGYVLPVFYFLWSLKTGAIAGANPWGASGLEWEIPSPPPTGAGSWSPIPTGSTGPGPVADCRTAHRVESVSPSFSCLPRMGSPPSR